MKSKKNLMNGEAEVDRFPTRRVLYGLPCAQCKIYYSADLLVCPVCQCRERVPAPAICVGVPPRENGAF
jgi:hypothetical protein